MRSSPAGTELRRIDSLFPGPGEHRSSASIAEALALLSRCERRRPSAPEHSAPSAPEVSLPGLCLGRTAAAVASPGDGAVAAAAAAVGAAAAPRYVRGAGERTSDVDVATCGRGRSSGFGMSWTSSSSLLALGSSSSDSRGDLSARDRMVCLFVCHTAQRHYLGPYDATTRAAAASLTLAACGKAAYYRLKQF